MVFSRPQLRLLSILALFIAVSQANWFDSHIFNRDAPKVARINLSSALQSVVTGVLESSSGTPSATASSSSSGATNKATVKTTSSSVVSSTSSPPSSAATSSSALETISTSSPSSTTPPPTTSSPSSTASSESVTVSASVAISTQVITVSGSLLTSLTSSTSYTTSTPTSAASLNGNATSSSSMSSKTKTTIIGVVVGIGGAIILAGLAIVAWRIWGRKKNEDESDGLMGFRGGSSYGHEKTGSASATGGPAPNPFQSTLENYHNPAKQTPVNASSNF